MRVISGIYKGRKLAGFDMDGTRPTMDRVKESMFGMIQNYIKDSIVLDLFSGTGSLGIEAISNGSKECYFVDKSKEAIKTITINTKGIENIRIINQDSLKFLDEVKRQFDIIFLDPPYHENLMDKVLEKIIKNNLLKADGIIVCEYEGSINCNLKLLKEKNYSIKTVSIYQK